MRPYLVLLVVALPTAAATTAAVAAPSLQCSADGNNMKVVIVNSDGKDKRCDYACTYTIKNGTIKLSGTERVRAGKTYTRQDTHREKIENVSENSLQCE